MVKFIETNQILLQLQIIQPKQPKYKTFYQCICCENKIGPAFKTLDEFDSQEELLSHLAIHHFKNFIGKEISDSVVRFPYCPHQDCDYLSQHLFLPLSPAHG